MQQLNNPNMTSNPALEISTSAGFNTWLNKHNGRLSIFERTFDRSRGLSVKDSTLYISSLYQIWGFQNAL